MCKGDDFFGALCVCVCCWRRWVFVRVSESQAKDVFMCGNISSVRVGGRKASGLCVCVCIRVRVEDGVVALWGRIFLSPKSTTKRKRHILIHLIIYTPASCPPQRKIQDRQGGAL